MSSSERIIEAAITIFGQYGYRGSSMELVAQEAGLTRQALYHHYDSKEAIFRACIAAVNEGAYAVEKAAGLAQMNAGRGLADIITAQIVARFNYLIDCLKSPLHAGEILSERQRQTRDLYQNFNDQKLELLVQTITTFCAASGDVLRDDITPLELARSLEFAMHGFELQKADKNLLSDLVRVVRLIIAGALLSSANRKSVSRTPSKL
jgi:AcrR family transcriptional regulator